jgi:hypothetical protein
MALNAQTARAVLAQAKKDGTYEAPIPEDDETAIFEATELVDQARAAWEANIRGPEVEAIINLAAADDEDGDESEGEDGDDADENLAEIEPWEDFDKESAADIKGALDWSLENEPDSFLDLAKHVWEYESAHKARKGIIEHLGKLAETVGGGGDDEPEGEAEVEDDLAELDRDGLKKLIKVEGLGTLAELGINKKTTDDEIREIIRNARPEPEQPEPEDEPEPEPEEEPEADEPEAEDEPDEEPESEEEVEPEPEEKPKARKRPARKKADEPTEDEAKGSVYAVDGVVTGKVIITREQILAALESGTVEITV